MKLKADLSEAQRLLDAGFKLVPLIKDTKQPWGDGWNDIKNAVTEIHPKATGYGMTLAHNGLCSVDPDNVEMAEKGLAALGFSLEEIMSAGCRTCSTRPQSGGRSTFKADDDFRWIRFATKGIGIALELRAYSDNLQDAVPGVVYYDKDGNECQQYYDPFNEYQLDNAPFVPEKFAAWWKRMSEDNAFYIEQQILFFEAIGVEWFKTNTHGKHLYGESRMRVSYNENHSVEDLLRKHGYEDHGNNRWSAPEATGQPGIRPIPGKNGLWRSDHGSDVLNGTFDAWTAYVLLEHGGDVDAAERAEGECILDGFEVLADDGAVMSGFDALEAEARGVTGRDSFKAFAAKVSAVRNEVLNATDRTMLAGIIAGLKVLDGMTKANIAAALKFSPPKLADHRDRPKYERDDDGSIRNTVGNIILALSSEGEIGIRIALDTFVDGIKFSKDGGLTWIDFGDQHYIDVLMYLEKLGIYGITTNRVRECVYSVAVTNSIDTAQIWLGSLKWDGVPRVERFFIDYFGAEESAYSKAVGRYIWSALAGRILVPGIQADMIPVLVGKQGVRKSTSIAAMSPSRDFFSELSFLEPETESARKMRGCLVGELAELKGIHSKDKEHIKAWLTRTHEHWTPKYKEFAITFPRRHMFIGSTNNEQFLEEDSSGQRRWLPIKVGMGKVDDIVRDRDQLWAEGAVLFGECEGICFRDAERLARAIHGDFTREDIFLVPIIDYLEAQRDMTGGWKGLSLTTNQIMTDALGMDDAKSKPYESGRVNEIMVRQGWRLTRPRTVDLVDPKKVHRYATWIYDGEGE